MITQATLYKPLWKTQRENLPLHQPRKAGQKDYHKEKMTHRVKHKVRLSQMDCLLSQNIVIREREINKDYCLYTKIKRNSMDKAAEQTAALDDFMHPMTRQILLEMTPAKAFKRLQDGNQRFQKQLGGSSATERNLRDFVDETSHNGQYPFAIILSCMDSRTSPTTVFDQTIGDIFSIRVAGNYVTEEILGGMEFACTRQDEQENSLSPLLIVVMGHTGCGAIASAVKKVYPDDAHPAIDSPVFPPNISHLLDRLIPAIKTTRHTLGPEDRHLDKNELNDFVNRAALTNVFRTIDNILIQSDIIRHLYNSNKIWIRGAMYDIETGKVNFIKNKS